MFDKDKIREQLREQVHRLRQRIAELKKSEVDRTQAEEEIDRARSDLNQIFNAAVPLCVINKDYIILRVNDTFRSLFGLRKGEFEGELCHKVWQGPLCNTPQCPMQQILSGKKISEYEIDKKLSDGRAVSCIITAIPYLGPDGEVIGIVENFTDITERKRMEDELHTYQSHLEDVVRMRTIQLTAANEQLQQEIAERKRAEETTKFAYAELNQIFNAAADGMCVINKDLKVIRVNDTFCTLFGLKKDEVEDKDCHTAFHHSLCNVFACPISLMFKGEESFERDVEIDRSDGKKIYCILTATPFRSSDGELIGFVENFKDITEHKKAEEELQRVQKLESIGVLAGGIAHDFNNLLTAIIGNLSLLDLYIKSENNVSKVLKETEKASLQAKHLTSQLLTFSKGGLPVKKTTSISELLRNTADFALSGSKAKCELSFSDDLWWAEIDEGQISQVFNNLLINAVQAMSEGGIIAISAENITIRLQDRVNEARHTSNDVLPLKEGKYVKISIKDPGVGIPEKYLNQIFDPYFTTRQEGTGLGLSIAYSIIKSHGGYITVESLLGVGTVFRIYLPASAKKLPVRKEISDEELYSGKGRILFMDDQQSIRDMAGEMLADLGYEVAYAREGDEAVELYA
ncbi:MAG TPA: PAS domain-containing protein, partial [Desulfatiglandales bacterium]|nr:PAS domain-containing protein [Desulfatiglandales bacterium]